jgi:hypothetical protein
MTFDEFEGVKKFAILCGLRKSINTRKYYRRAGQRTDSPKNASPKLYCGYCARISYFC